ncbi:unnamed protein product [Linum trigynum]|uniref:DUF4283 domain-containing protein n=1 Tax=Linum trigynum TaxID=586398 RepID=A0AAV2ETR5_9ROSI
MLCGYWFRHQDRETSVRVVAVSSAPDLSAPRSSFGSWESLPSQESHLLRTYNWRYMWVVVFQKDRFIIGSIQHLVVSMDPMDIDEVVDFEDSDVDIGPVQAQISLVGRLFALRPLFRLTMDSVANGMWGTPTCPIIVHEAENGMWRFIVVDDQVRERIVRRCPWTVKGFVLHWIPWAPITPTLVKPASEAKVGRKG